MTKELMRELGSVLEKNFDAHLKRDHIDEGHQCEMAGTVKLPLNSIGPCCDVLLRQLEELSRRVEKREASANCFTGVESMRVLLLRLHTIACELRKLGVSQGATNYAAVNAVGAAVSGTRSVLEMLVRNFDGYCAQYGQQIGQVTDRLTSIVAILQTRCDCFANTEMIMRSLYINTCSVRVREIRRGFL